MKKVKKNNNKTLRTTNLINSRCTGVESSGKDKPVDLEFRCRLLEHKCNFQPIKS